MFPRRRNLGQNPILHSKRSAYDFVRLGERLTTLGAWGNACLPSRRKPDALGPSQLYRFICTATLVFEYLLLPLPALIVLIWENSPELISQDSEEGFLKDGSLTVRLRIRLLFLTVHVYTMADLASHRGFGVVAVRGNDRPFHFHGDGGVKGQRQGACSSHNLRLSIFLVG